MPNSRLIDAALTARLIGDATLMAILTDGVFFDQAKQGATKFAIVSLIEEEDIGVFGGRAIEDGLYLVKAVALGTSGVDIGTAAARIDVLMEDVPLTGVSGYTGMTVFREGRVRVTEVDDSDPSIRWQHAGGRYRCQMSVTGM